MKRAVFAVIAVGILAVVGGLAWFFTSGDDEPTSVLTAPPIEAAATTTPASTDQTTESLPSDETDGTVAAATDTFTISSDLSLASFTLQEELRGAETTVLGTTDQVAGQIAVDFDNPAASVLGPVVVNARTIETDSANRTRAVRGAILDTGNFEFITFTPTQFDGLPTEPADSFSFTVTGDLTIRDITMPVTFAVDVANAAGAIEGTATATVNRTDFGLEIPNVPFVANVAEEVTLTLEFVALP